MAGGRRFWRRRALVAAVLLCAGAWVASSFAAGALTTTSKAISLGDEEVAGVTARCGSGTKVVSGGFKTASASATVPDTIVTANQPKSRRAWGAKAGNSGEPAELRVYAYCRDSNLRTSTETVPAPAGSTDSVTASCPNGTKAVSGGYRATPVDYVAPTTPVMRIAESRRAGKRKWIVSYFNNGNANASITAYVNCGTGKSPTAREVSESLTDAGGTVVTPIKSRCKRGEQVVAGGFASPEPGKAQATIVSTRRRGGRTWLVQARTGLQGAPVVVSAYAYCREAQ